MEFLTNNFLEIFFVYSMLRIFCKDVCNGSYTHCQNTDGVTLQKVEFALEISHSAKSSMGTSEKMYALLPKMNPLQIFFIYVESKRQLMSRNQFLLF